MLFYVFATINCEGSEQQAVDYGWRMSNDTFGNDGTTKIGVEIWLKYLRNAYTYVGE